MIVDDHAIVRTGLKRLVEDHSLCGDVIEANSGEQALELCQSREIQLVLLDLALPGISGLETSRRLLKRDPTMAIIILTGSNPGAGVSDLLQMGVRGYLTKGCSAAEMDQAITEVIAGRRYLSADVAQRLALAGQVADCERSPFDALTTRETEVVHQLLDGKRNHEIGKALYISDKTVSTHRARAFEKLGVNSTAELTRLAMSHKR